jgi:hypothetical protein
MGYHYDGGFAELMIVPAPVLAVDGLHRIPAGVSFAEASIAEPLACFVNGQTLARVGPGDDVVVIGAGPIGRLHVRLARARAAARVFLTDLNTERLHRAADLVKPDAALVGADVDVVAEIAARPDGRGVDAVIVAAASGRAQEQAQDPQLRDRVAELVHGGVSAPHAIDRALADFRSGFVAAGGYLAERAADLDDLRDRAVAVCLNQPMPGIPDPGRPYVLSARDLAPADTAGLDPAVVLALVTAEGGPTAHTAIVVRTLGIPAVVRCGGVLEIPDGTPVAVDGLAGTVEAEPDPAAVATARRREDERRAPMVATAEEAARFRDRCQVAGLSRVGVMVEIPSAALCAPAILSTVDFLSIGTNDLSQYTFAADRQCGQLADPLDPWQPALLSLVANCARAGQAVAKPVGVCGEAAADPLLAVVLVGLGVSSLSMAPRAIPAVRQALASQTREQCRQLAERVLVAADPAAARPLCRHPQRDDPRHGGARRGQTRPTPCVVPANFRRRRADSRRRWGQSGRLGRCRPVERLLQNSGVAFLILQDHDR